MIPEIGHLAVIIALVAALVGGILPHVAIRDMNKGLMQLGDRLAVIQFGCIAVAFASLVYAFIISDFSVRLVAAHSHSLKPLLYKISGVWGNHEGSLLLWVLILTFFAALVAWRGRALPLEFRARVLAVQSLLTFGFLLFILVTSNPFDRLVTAPFEGNGLNPLLQDPGLAFHPPMLYLGYVGLSIAFSFAVAALINGQVTPQWARWVRPWTLLAWIFLTGGIALGSWWAYYELGWGGWWFWDPVENASFMPWLAATALLHSAIVVEKRETLKSWTILLAIVAFSFSLLGTFLVRSGVLTSVHAFAVDPARGIFILVFLAIVVGGSLTLYALRAPGLAPAGLFSMVSRESALVLNNLLLGTFAAVVLVGTLYPLFVEAFGGGQISVGPPYFNFATIVIISPLVVALTLAPFLTWKRAKLSRAMAFSLPAFIVGLVVAGGVFWNQIGGSVLTLFGLVLGLWLLASVVMDILQKSRAGGRGSVRVLKLLRLPRAYWGMSLAHGGLAVIILGITISEAWSTEELRLMAPGESVSVAGYRFTLNHVEPGIGPNYTRVVADFSVFDAMGDRVARLRPEDRLYASPVMNTTEAAIAPLITGDLYAVIGEWAGDNRWSVRLYFKPALSGLWLGAMMMMIGGLISLTDRRLRVGAAMRKQTKDKNTGERS